MTINRIFQSLFFLGLNLKCLFRLPLGCNDNGSNSSPFCKVHNLNYPAVFHVFIGLTDTRRSSIMIGVVYVILYLGSAYASRNSHRLANFAGGEQRGTNLLWKVVFILYLALIPLLFFKYYYIAVVGFVLLSLIQNFWRPMLISRFDDFASETQGATILSIESHAKSVSTMLVAPVMGVAVDYLIGRNLGGEFWPVATIAAIIALFIIITAKKHDLSHIEDKNRK